MDELVERVYSLLPNTLLEGHKQLCDILDISNSSNAAMYLLMMAADKHLGNLAGACGEMAEALHLSDEPNGETLQ